MSDEITNNDRSWSVVPKGGSARHPLVHLPLYQKQPHVTVSCKPISSLGLSVAQICATDNLLSTVFSGLQVLNQCCGSWKLAGAEQSCMMFAGFLTKSLLTKSPLTLPHLKNLLLIGVTGQSSCLFLKVTFLYLFLLVMMAKEKPPITVVGDVGGRIAIIVVRPQTCMWKLLHPPYWNMSSHTTSVLERYSVRTVWNFWGTTKYHSKAKYCVPGVFCTSWDSL